MQQLSTKTGRFFPQWFSLRRQPVCRDYPVAPFLLLFLVTFPLPFIQSHQYNSVEKGSELVGQNTKSQLRRELLTEWDHNYLFPSVSQHPVEWEEASVRVRLSEGGSRRRRDLREKEYHTLHVHIPTRKHDPNVVIRLKKRSTLLSPTFKVVVRDGNGDAEEIQEAEESSYCHYYGTVTSANPNSSYNRRKGNKHAQGTAALSSCGNSGGYRGIIMMQDGDWIIEPHPVINSSTSQKKSLPHIILPPNSTRDTSNFISDELKVPQEALEAAAALAVAEAKQRQREKERENPPSSDRATLLSPAFRGGDHEFFGRGQPLALAFASEDTGSFIQSRKRIRNSDTITKTPKEDGKKTIEIAVFTDYELYNKIGKKYPGNTTTKLKDYVTTMINTMDLLYRQPSLGVDIEFRLVHLEILKKRQAKLNNSAGKAKAYLSSFCEFAGEMNVNSGLWDHALLLTGLDLHEEGVKNTAGLAWAGTMCYRYYSCSISEGTTFGAAYIITHEIGHSLGMEHDGVGVSDKCDRDKFIMSPTTGPGKTNWSSCSSGNLKDFLEYGTSELRGRKASNKPSCLSEIVSRTKKNIEFSSGTLLPGEKYDSSQQCLLAIGPLFKPYYQKNSPPFHDICWMLHCGNGTHAISTHPALEGTKCDKDKHCRKGKCVKRK